MPLPGKPPLVELTVNWVEPPAQIVSDGEGVIVGTGAPSITMLAVVADAALPHGLNGRTCTEPLPAEPQLTMMEAVPLPEAMEPPLTVQV